MPSAARIGSGGAIPAPTSATTRRRVLFAAGLVGGLIALLSVVDMFLPKPYDGAVPDPYSTGGILIRDLVPGGAAEQAGLKPGDVILGIGHRMLNRAAEAPPELRRHRIGEPVDYLVRRGDKIFETRVVLSSFRLGSGTYLYYALLGALFFALGLFVVSRRPDDPAVGVFFVLCILFMLFFVCRLRPSSYYWIDYFVQVAGTLALFLLPAVFLHFFLLFPRRKVLRFAGPEAPGLRRFQDFLNGSPLFFTLLYTLPPVLYVLQMASQRGGSPRRLIYGAPTLNWILLADYLILGLLALAHSFWTDPDPKARKPILVLLLGTIAGIVPFVVFAVFYPSLFRDERYLAWGVVPMALIPLAFGTAIVRFRLFEVQVIVRKSLVYGVLTAIVTAIYALAVVAGNALLSSFSTVAVTSSPAFAFVFGLAVVLLFDPLRRRAQSVVDRVFFRDRADFQRAILDMSRSVVSQLERDKIRELMTERTAELLRLSSLDLLLPRPADGALADPRGDGRSVLPMGSRLPQLLARQPAPVRLSALESRTLDEASRRFLESEARRGVKVLVPVATRGHLLGLLAVGSKRSEEELSREDLDHLATIANQGALGLEAAGLHEQLTRQAEVERDLEIARDIQVSLFPRRLPKVAGAEFFGVSRPARVVGGDFYDFLEVDGAAGRLGLVLGDVSGKSIPAALLMVAAKEIVYARAISDPDPAVVFREANRRLYEIKRRMFVSLGYFLFDSPSLSLHYALGGQPTPLLVRGGSGAAGTSVAMEIPAPKSRLPLGAFRDVPYDAATCYLSPGDLLLFYTDGLSEAMSEDASPYGDERLKASLVRHAALPLPELADELLEDVRQFTHGAEQYDDETFVLMRVAPGR